MTKSNPLPHPHMLNNAHPVPWKRCAKFQPGWPFDKLLIAKQLPVGVAIMLTQLLGDHTPNFSLIDTYIILWKQKQPSVGVPMKKPHQLLHLYMLNYADPVPWKPHANFSLVGLLISLR